MRSRRSRISLRISACTVTSSAVVGSSAIEQLRVHRQRLGDHRPLPLTTRQLVRVGVDAPLGVGDLDQLRAARSPARGPASGDIAWWLRSISAIWNPIVYTGLSAVIGSWKITDTSRAADLAQRRARRCRRARWPPSLIEPRTRRVLRQQAHQRHRDRSTCRTPTRRRSPATSPAWRSNVGPDRPPGTTCRRPRSRCRGRGPETDRFGRRWRSVVTAIPSAATRAGTMTAMIDVFRPWFGRVLTVVIGVDLRGDGRVVALPTAAGPTALRSAAVAGARRRWRAGRRSGARASRCPTAACASST